MSTTIRFHLEMGGYPGPFFTVRLNGPLLHCTLKPRLEDAAETYSVAITGNEAWQELVGYLATRRWQALFENANILDGTHWSLHFTHKEEGIVIRSSGSNSYPPGYRKMLHLVNKVLEPIGLNVY